MHNDNDDDGETAAGSRLAHLLQILVSELSVIENNIWPWPNWTSIETQELDHILVVVTRYFGGVHLGPDRWILYNPNVFNSSNNLTLEFS